MMIARAFPVLSLASIAPLVAACGAAAVDVAASGEEPAAVPRDGPAAEEPATPTAAPAVPREDPLCRRHYRELMAPPAAARPPIDCGRVDRIAYWRWTVAGGARSIAHLRLERGGAAVVEYSGGGAGDAGGASSPLKRAIDPAAAAAAVRKTCEAFNREYDPGQGIGCPAGSRLVEFFEGEVKAGRAEALPCDSRAMSEVLDDLDRLLDRR